MTRLGKFAASIRKKVAATLERQGVLDPASLQFRLAAGITLISALSIVGASGWMSWRAQQILIGSQKQQLYELAERLPQDIGAYQEMMTTDAAIEKSVEVRSLPDVSITITDPQGEIIAQSEGQWHNAAFIDDLRQRPTLPGQPEVFQLEGRHYVGCEGLLVVEGVTLGQMHLALDITDTSQMFGRLIQSLAITAVLVMGVITVAIALFVRRSVRPLRQISQMTADLTIDDLDHVQFHLENAPTEVRELAQTCEITLRRLAEALSQQRQFVHDISHELRTPLTVVYGYLQSTLRRCHTLNELQRDALESAASETERTIRLLQELLDLARVDSGSLTFSKQPIPLNSLVESVLRFMQTSCDHTLQLDATHPDIYALADPDRLKQVLLNLLENAIRYSEVDQPINVKLDQQGNSAIIQVCDRGVGIPLQHQSRIFDRCYRVDEARARSTGGCGLGLSIVKALVDGMEGRISVQSEPDRGSVFTVTLPLPHNDHDRQYRSRRRRRKTSPLH